MLDNELKQKYENYLKDKRERLKVKIDTINSEFELYLLENFIEGLLDDE